MILLKTRKYLISFIFIVFSLFFISTGSSETFHVGLYPNPPFIFPENSDFPGLTVDIINKLADQNNFDVIYHYNTYETNLDLISIGMIDILPAFNNKNINNSLYSYQIHMNSDRKDDCSCLNSENIFIPCILIKNRETASLLTDHSLYSKIVPLTHPFKAEAVFDRSILDRYRAFLIPSFLENRFSLFFLSVIFFLIILILSFIHLPVLKSISRNGREIISEVESPDFYSFINSIVCRLVKSDFFCIGDFDQGTLNLNIFSRESSSGNKTLNENFNRNESLFLYAVMNRKAVYIKDCDKDFIKFVRNNISVKNIDSKINSVFIMPLLLNSQPQGAIAVLDRRKNAFPYIKRFLILSISKYITISLKNRKLIISNRELLKCIENDKNQILKAKQEVEYLAQHDPLTNLPNRLYLNEFLNQSIKKSNRTGKKLAVLFIDMDNFKEVNDTYGHQTGDKVLIATSKRFKNLLRESDIVIRFGGDEFIIILEDVNSSDDIKQVANKVINTCSAPVLTESADLSLSFSIGISIYPDDGSSSDELIRKADIALYDVKNDVKGKWKFYSE